MRLLTLLLTVLLTACVQQPEVVEEGRSTASVNTEAPYLWSNYSASKTLYLSNNFTDAESQVMVDMAAAWKTALEDKKTFFNVSSSKIANKANNINPDLLLDSTLGIYKLTSWPQDIPEDALAVTQIFGRRYNAGTSDEFVGIEHADILVNYQWFAFDPDDVSSDYDGDYDLPTVILHEMGHFLGLGHIPRGEDRTSSVMYPSITSREVKRTPQGRDILELAGKYEVNLGSGATNALADSSSARPRIRDNDSGIETRIMMELRASGECVHKVDGSIVSRHKLMKR